MHVRKKMLNFIYFYFPKNNFLEKKKYVVHVGQKYLIFFFIFPKITFFREKNAMYVRKMILVFLFIFKNLKTYVMHARKNV